MTTTHRPGCPTTRTGTCHCTYLSQWDSKPALNRTVLGEKLIPGPTWPVPDTLYDDAEDCAELFKHPGTLTPGPSAAFIAAQENQDRAYNRDVDALLHDARTARKEARWWKRQHWIMVGIAALNGAVLYAKILGWF